MHACMHVDELKLGQGQVFDCSEAFGKMGRDLVNMDGVARKKVEKKNLFVSRHFLQWEY